MNRKEKASSSAILAGGGSDGMTAEADFDSWFLYATTDFVVVVVLTVAVAIIAVAFSFSCGGDR